jgi:uncharacterized phiE125 gp8 family phage protein
MARQQDIITSCKRYAEPSTEPITLIEAKAQAKVRHNNEDDWFNDKIAAAREHVEDAELWRTLITTAWTMYLDSFPDEIRVPMPPLQSVTSLKYYDTDNVQQTLVLDTDYEVDASSEPARIKPYYGTTWPATRTKMNAVELKFSAGYGAASDVPRSIRHAIAMIVAHWCINREVTISGTIIAKVPLAAEHLLAGKSMKGFV